MRSARHLSRISRQSVTLPECQATKDVHLSRYFLSVLLKGSGLSSHLSTFGSTKVTGKTVAGASSRLKMLLNRSAISKDSRLGVVGRLTKYKLATRCYREKALSLVSEMQA